MVIDLIVISAVFSMAGATLRSLGSKFPGVEPMPGAIRKEFQSFRFDSVKLGQAVHVAVDEKHLHLLPAWFPRRIMRMPAMSIPWDAITLTEPSSRVHRMAVRRGMAMAQIAGVTVIGPAWCLQLADPTASEAQPGTGQAGEESSQILR